MESPAAPTRTSELYAQVYQALDASIASSTCLAWSEAQVQRALWDARGSSDRRMLAELEQMSVDLNRLAIATRGGNQKERDAVLERLRSVARSWMDRVPVH